MFIGHAGDDDNDLEENLMREKHNIDAYVTLIFKFACFFFLFKTKLIDNHIQFVTKHLCLFRHWRFFYCTKWSIYQLCRYTNTNISLWIDAIMHCSQEIHKKKERRKIKITDRRRRRFKKKIENNLIIIKNHKAASRLIID